MNKYAFLDRDGVLIYEPTLEDTKDGDIPYQIDSIEKLKILPGVLKWLKELITDGYRLVMVSNQNGIGTESFPQKDFDIPQNRMLEVFRENGIEFDEVFVCSHMPEDDCGCRKPKTGLVDEFFSENEIDMEASFMCGDRGTDRQFAENLGLRFVKMRTNGRTAFVSRNTNETQINLEVNLDGTGVSDIDTGIGFLDHMLELLSKHSLIDMKMKAVGDLNVDKHHTVEDTGIVLGQALKQAIGDKRGLERYGFFVPMDESLAEVVIDLGGRAYLVWNAEFKREKIGEMPTELFEEFFQAVAANLEANIHVNVKYGRNEHHIAEAIFKAFARALKVATSIDARSKDLLPSTKGKL